MSEFAVAFSHLSSDEQIAQEIRRFLPSDCPAFIYTEEQERLIGAPDSVEELAIVFRRAKVVVVLFRNGWGESRWTRLESGIIKDRLLEEGPSFLVLVRLDDSPLLAWLPHNDFWVDYATEGPERAASYIASRQTQLANPDAVLRSTRRTYTRQPIPISRYQLQFQKMMEVYTPVRPEICDACTSAVVFRPLHRVILPATDTWPAVEERLCPRCARDRGIRVHVPKDFEEVTVFEKNPTYAQHIRRILAYPVIPSLSQQPDLIARGVTHVGGGFSTTQISFFVSMQAGVEHEISIPIWQLQQENVCSDSELIEYAKAKILESL